MSLLDNTNSYNSISNEKVCRDCKKLFIPVSPDDDLCEECKQKREDVIGDILGGLFGTNPSGETVIETFDETVYESAPDGATIVETVTEDFSNSKENNKFSFSKGDLLLDTYRIESNPIHGGMGSVWRVRHMNWDVDLAMKRPKKEYFVTDNQKEIFTRECESWINLGLHPNIVSCYYVREIDGVPTIFSEWMENGDLESHIQDGSLYEGSDEEVQKRLLDIAIQFARGLHYAHENGLIHQDVKPGNLLLTKNWEAKVSDFGLASACSALTILEGDWTVREENPGATIFTPSGGRSPAYCSPEQMGAQLLTRRTDIYSWAVSILEMYLGDRPWAHGNEATGPMVGSICEEYYDSSRVDIPENLREVLTCCLAIKPENRFHDFSEIETILKGIYHKISGNEYFRTSPQSASDTADSLNNRALSFLDLGKYDEAEKCWERALSKNAGHKEAVFNRTLFLWRQGRIDFFEDTEDLLNVLNDSNKEKEMQDILYEECLGEIGFSKESSVPDRQHYLRSSVTGRKHVYLKETGDSILILEEKTDRLVYDFKKVYWKNGNEYFCQLSPDNRILAISRFYKYDSETEFRDIDSGKIIAFREDCRFLGFEWDGSAILYDKDDNILFGCKEDDSFSSFSQSIHDSRIDRYSDNRFFYQISEELGLIEVSEWNQDEHKSLGYLLVCNLQTGKVLKEILENPYWYYTETWHYLYKEIIDSQQKRFSLIDEGKYFLWIYNDKYNYKNGKINIAVWEVGSWRYLGLYILKYADEMMKHPERLHFTPGKRADYRVSVIENTDVRLDAQTKFDSLLEEADKLSKEGKNKSAIQKVDEALQISGFANSSKAFRLRAEITDTFKKRKPVRIVVSDEIVLPPEISDHLSDKQEALSDAVSSAMRKLREDVQNEWYRDNDALNEWEVHVSEQMRSSDGSRVLVKIVTINRDDSPAQYDVEISFSYGAAVLDGSTGQMLYVNKDYCFIDVEPYENLEAMYFYPGYKTFMDKTGKYLLTRTPQKVIVTDIDEKTEKEILNGRQGNCSHVEFIENNKYLLCKSKIGFDVIVVCIETKEKVVTGFSPNEYGDIRLIDNNSFSVKHGKDEVLCWIVWDPVDD